MLGRHLPNETRIDAMLEPRLPNETRIDVMLGRHLPNELGRHLPNEWGLLLFLLEVCVSMGPPMAPPKVVFPKMSPAWKSDLK